MTASAAAVPSTPIEFVSRLTEQAVTPGTFETAFSTLALQAAQLIPVTVYCSIYLLLSYYSPLGYINMIFNCPLPRTMNLYLFIIDVLKLFVNSFIKL